MSSGIILAHLTFSLLLFLLLPTRRFSPRVQVGILLGCFALSFVTVDGLSMGDYTRSYTDDLAITSLLWFSWCVSCRLGGCRSLSSRHHLQLTLCFAGMALFLYPATLGLSQLDPYRLGFSPMPLLIAMWLLCVFLWLQGNRLAFWLITIATAAYLLDVKDSNNYWDYLIDPVLGIYCLAHLIGRVWPLGQSLFSRLAFRRQAGEAELVS